VSATCDPAFPQSTDYALEIDKAQAVLTSATGVGADFFIFPFDVCDPLAVAHLKAHGYLGARCGIRGLNPPDLADPFAVAFDVYGPAFSIYANAPACQGITQWSTPPAQAPAACRAYVLDQLMNEAIAQKGYSMRVLHGFDGDRSWEPVSLADYTAHLDAVAGKVKAGTLWVEGPTTVLKYRQAREQCPLPLVSGRTLQFPAPSVSCARVATVLTYKVSMKEGAHVIGLQARQAGVSRPARKLDNSRFLVDADPTQGDVVLIETPS
jgi:hypothetical protein